MDLRKKKIVATLVFPIRDGKVLLAKKARILGIGLWNGWGGEREKGETIHEAALREFQTESNCRARIEDLVYVGKVTFHNNKNGREFDVEVHMFLLFKWDGECKPKIDEMFDPTFWPVGQLPPDEEFMPSDPDWMPLVLAGKWIEGETWQKWIDQGPDKPPLVVLAKPSEIRLVEKLGDID